MNESEVWNKKYAEACAENNRLAERVSQLEGWLQDRRGMARAYFRLESVLKDIAVAKGADLGDQYKAGFLMNMAREALAATRQEPVDDDHEKSLPELMNGVDATEADIDSGPVQDFPWRVADLGAEELARVEATGTAARLKEAEHINRDKECPYCGMKTPTLAAHVNAMHAKESERAEPANSVEKESDDAKTP